MLKIPDLKPPYTILALQVEKAATVPSDRAVSWGVTVLREAGVKVQPTYASIQCVCDLVEPWIELLGGDEWGDSMRALHGACHTDYGFSDEDCALFAAKLLENLEICIESESWGYVTRDQFPPVQAKCREIREYWHKGGNLTDWEPAITAANETLAQMPSWMFGE